MVVDTGIRESLIEAGLVDPSGAFTSAPNFGGPSEGGGGPLRPEPEPEQEGGDEPQSQPTQEPASQPQVRPTESAPTPDPGARGDVGPQDAARLGADADPVRRQYDTQIAQLDQMAELAFANGRSLVDGEGRRVFTDEQLAYEIGRELQSAKQQAYLAGVMQKMQPVAKRSAAEQIAKEHGVEVEDILNEESPIAMRTRAKTIAELKRDGRFQSRKESGVDTAEGSRSLSNAIPEALDKLSPLQKIYVGFARGDH